MLHRPLSIAFALAAAVALAGCDANAPNGGYGRGGYFDPCTQFRSCDQCTPIIGCGWCSYGKGQGICLAAPNECATTEFSWTWDPAGCSGVNPADAGAVSGQSDAPSEGAALEAAGGQAEAASESSTSDDAGGASDAPGE